MNYINKLLCLLLGHVDVRCEGTDHSTYHRCSRCGRETKPIPRTDGCTPVDDPFNAYKCRFSSNLAAAGYTSSLCPAHKRLGERAAEIKELCKNIIEMRKKAALGPWHVTTDPEDPSSTPMLKDLEGSVVAFTPLHEYGPETVNGNARFISVASGLTDVCASAVINAIEVLEIQGDADALETVVLHWEKYIKP